MTKKVQLVLGILIILLTLAVVAYINSNKITTAEDLYNRMIINNSFENFRSLFLDERKMEFTEDDYNSIKSLFEGVNAQRIYQFALFDFGDETLLFSLTPGSSKGKISIRKIIIPTKEVESFLKEIDDK